MNITLPLKSLIAELLQFHECVALRDPNIAKLIWIYDQQEELCHIEFPTADNKLLFPLLYSKASWMNCLERATRLRSQAAAERSILLTRTEKLLELKAAISRKFALNPKNREHAKRIDALATILLDSGASPIGDHLGIDITHVPASPFKVNVIKKGKRNG